MLTSYDTQLFFVILFIPLIPLGHKRVIDQCSHCRRHRVLNLEKWNELQAQCDEALEAWRRSPESSELIRKAMESYASIKDMNGFKKLAQEAEASFASNVDVLVLLADIQEFFGQHADTERLLRKAMDLKDEEAVRERLGQCLLKLGKVAEAAPLLIHIAEKAIPDKVGLLYELAQGYQINGDHENASRIFGICELVNPLIGRDETFKKLKAISEKKKGTSQKVNPNAEFQKMKNWNNFQKFLKAAPIALAIALAAYAGYAWSLGQWKGVWLANGLKKQYEAVVNGKSYNLGPESAQIIRIGEGAVKVELKGTRMAVPAIQGEIRSPFWSRPFKSNLAIINPDQAALLAWQRVYYSSKNEEGRKPDVQMHGGQAFYSFTDIDYAFEEVPKSITTRSSSYDVSKDQVTLLPKSPAILMAAADRLDTESFKTVAVRLIQLDQGDDVLFHLVSNKFPKQEYLKALRSSLDVQPLAIEVHREYIRQMKEAGMETQGEEEYAARLEKDPKNPDLLYLAGASKSDPDLSHQLIEQAAAATPPCILARRSCCFYALSQADYVKAEQLSMELMAKMPKDNVIQEVMIESKEALGKYEELLDWQKKQAVGDLGQMAHLYREILWTASKGDVAAAEKKCKDAISRLTDEYGAEAAEGFRQQINPELLYIKQALSDYVKYARNSESAEMRFMAAVTTGTLDVAEGEIAKLDETDKGNAFLVLYIGAMQKNDLELAGRYLPQACKTMRGKDLDSEKTADALEGKPSWPAEKIARLSDLTNRKAVILTALGLSDAQNRELYFGLARKLNFSKSPPHLLLAATLGPGEK